VPLTKNKSCSRKRQNSAKNLSGFTHTVNGCIVPKSVSRAKSQRWGALCKGGAGHVGTIPERLQLHEATETVTVGGGTFTPVSKTVWYFEVSGFKVVQSWLGYRMKDRKGKKSSPLDDIHPERWTYEFTWEFLELLGYLKKRLTDIRRRKKYSIASLLQSYTPPRNCRRFPKKRAKDRRCPRRRARQWRCGRRNNNRQLRWSSKKYRQGRCYKQYAPSELIDIGVQQ